MDVTAALGAAVEPEPTVRRLLGQSAFRTLWFAQTISWLGDSFGFLALLWLVNSLTGSPAAMGGLMVAATIPRLVFGLTAGVFVDRWDRRLLMVGSDGLRAILTLGYLLAGTADRVWMVYVIAFVLGAVGVFFMPARGAVMKTILRPSDLLLANAFMQTTFTLTLLLGPALAGVTIGLWGAGPAFGFDAATFALSAALVATMTVPPAARSATAATGALSAFLTEFRQGLSFVSGSRTVLGILASLVVAMLAIGAINVLFVPFLTRDLGVGATELGLADSAQAAGMILGGVLVGALAARLRKVQIIVVGLAAIGATFIVLGLSPTYALVLGCMAAVGLALTPLEASLSALMQAAVPNEVMGRVGGVTNTLQSAAQLLSMGAAGVLAESLGVRAIFVAAGVIIIASGALAAVTIKEP